MYLLNEFIIITLNVQNVHRWLTHIPAVACSSLFTALSMTFSGNADQIN